MAHPISSDFLALQTALAGRYSLERELGRGGMGIVYLAYEVALDRPVALKLLPAEMAAGEEVRRRFLQEARTAAKLSHPNIVPIFTVDEVDGFVFYVMALVEGETLGERVRSRGPLSDSDATRLVREVAWALAYAHGQGVVHRDVKPDNIMLEHGTGRALVMDFGIAQAGAPAAEGSEGADLVQGTAEFMSPEQARGAPVDPRSDLYSLGVVGFYTVTGRIPFEGASPSVVLAKHVTEPAPPVASVAPHVPTPLARTVDRCLRKEPERRFQDGGEIADALAQDAAADRSLPVPLRVFIKNLRGWSRSSPAVILVLFLFLGMPLFQFALRGGTIGAVVALVALFAGLGAAGMYLASLARKLLKAGYTVEDARLALRQDVIQRNEEFRFEMGERETKMDRATKKVAIGGVALGALALTASLVGFGALAPIGGVSLGIGLLAAAHRASNARRRADITGEQWLKFLSGRFGDWLFKLGGMWLKTPEVIGAGTHRPTEMAISISAARLFEELPKETRETLVGLPDTVNRLEADARLLRQQLAELNGVLAEIGDDPAAPGSEARATVRAEVEATRDEAASRLREAVTALETIRLGLLRMHAGERVLQSVTMELETAKGLSGDMSKLLAGHREVERLLAERRATGVFTIVEGG
jgi:eukaryotic-like serine/threonine-protein kinase